MSLNWFALGSSGDFSLTNLDVDNGTLYVDKTEDRVGILTKTPSSTLQLGTSPDGFVYNGNPETGNTVTIYGNAAAVPPSVDGVTNANGTLWVNSTEPPALNKGASLTLGGKHATRIVTWQEGSETGPGNFLAGDYLTKFGTNKDKLGSVVYRSSTETWEEIGIRGFSGVTSGPISTAQYGSIIYVAFRDDSIGGKASVMQLDTAAATPQWTYVGPQGGASPGEAGSLSVAVDGSGGTLYLAFSDLTDTTNGGRLSVTRFSTVAGTWGYWDATASRYFSNRQVTHVSAVVAGGSLYVGYVDDDNLAGENGDVFVKSSTDGTFTLAFDVGKGTYAVLASNDTPGIPVYLAFRNSSGKIEVRSSDSPTTLYGGEEASPGTGVEPSLVISPSGSGVYLAYTDIGIDNHIVVTYATSSTSGWSVLGTRWFTERFTTQPHLQLLGLNLVLAVRDNVGAGGTLTVYRYDGISWLPFDGQVGVTDYGVDFPRIHPIFLGGNNFDIYVVSRINTTGATKARIIRVDESTRKILISGSIFEEESSTEFEPGDRIFTLDQTTNNVIREATVQAFINNSTGENIGFARASGVHRGDSSFRRGDLVLETLNEPDTEGEVRMHERLRITAAGDVGIGTSEPNTKLHVAGGALQADGIYSTGYLRLTSSAINTAGQNAPQTDVLPVNFLSYKETATPNPVRGRGDGPIFQCTDPNLSVPVWESRTFRTSDGKNLLVVTGSFKGKLSYKLSYLNPTFTETNLDHPSGACFVLVMEYSTSGFIPLWISALEVDGGIDGTFYNQEKFKITGVDVVELQAGAPPFYYICGYYPFTTPGLTPITYSYNPGALMVKESGTNPYNTTPDITPLLGPSNPSGTVSFVLRYDNNGKIKNGTTTFGTTMASATGQMLLTTIRCDKFKAYVSGSYPGATFSVRHRNDPTSVSYTPTALTTEKIILLSMDNQLSAVDKLTLVDGGLENASVSPNETTNFNLVVPFNTLDIIETPQLVKDKMQSRPVSKGGDIVGYLIDYRFTRGEGEFDILCTGNVEFSTSTLDNDVLTNEVGYGDDGTTKLIRLISDIGPSVTTSTFLPLTFDLRGSTPIRPNFFVGNSSSYTLSGSYVDLFFNNILTADSFAIRWRWNGSNRFYITTSSPFAIPGLSLSSIRTLEVTPGLFVDDITLPAGSYKFTAIGAYNNAAFIRSLDLVSASTPSVTERCIYCWLVEFDPSLSSRIPTNVQLVEKRLVTSSINTIPNQLSLAFKRRLILRENMQYGFGFTHSVYYTSGGFGVKLGMRVNSLTIQVASSSGSETSLPRQMDLFVNGRATMIRTSLSFTKNGETTQYNSRDLRFEPLFKEGDRIRVSNSGGAAEAEIIYLERFEDRVDVVFGTLVLVSGTTIPPINAAVDVVVESLGGTFSIGLGAGYLEESSIYLSGAYRSQNVYFYGSITPATTGNVPEYQLSPETGAWFNGSFVSKYTSSLALQWVSKIDGPKTDVGQGISVDNAGEIIVCGYSSGTSLLFYEYETPTAVKTAVTDTNTRGGLFGYVAKYSFLGRFRWVALCDGSLGDRPVAVTADLDNNVYVAIKTSSFTDFTMYNGTGVRYAELGWDTSSTAGSFVAIAKINPDGNCLLLWKIAGDRPVEPTSIYVDSNDVLFFSGHTTSSRTRFFNPDGSTMVYLDKAGIGFTSFVMMYRSYLTYLYASPSEPGYTKKLINTSGDGLYINFLDEVRGTTGPLSLPPGRAVEVIFDGDTWRETSDSELVTALFTVDKKNASVGIGTSFPRSTLDVIGTVSSLENVVISPDYLRKLKMFTDPVSSSVFIQAENSFGGSIPVVLQSKGGVVGIGTTPDTSSVETKDNATLTVFGRAGNASIQYPVAEFSSDGVSTVKITGQSTGLLQLFGQKDLSNLTLRGGRGSYIFSHLPEGVVSSTGIPNIDLVIAGLTGGEYSAFLSNPIYFPEFIRCNVELHIVQMFRNINEEYGVYDDGIGSPIRLAVNGRVLASFYSTPSDRRIKKEITLIDDGDALEKLRSIEPKSYYYVNRENRTEKVYGFIAQEVRERFPNAVTLTTSVIPDVYQLCPINLDEKTISLPGARDGRIQVQLTKTITAMMEVRLVEPGVVRYELIGEGFVDPGHVVDGKIFVHGYEVDDFHTLDKTYLFTLNFAATQEVDRLLQKTRLELEETKTRLTTAEEKLSVAEQELASIKAVLRERGIM